MKSFTDICDFTQSEMIADSLVLDLRPQAPSHLASRRIEKKTPAQR